MIRILVRVPALAPIMLTFVAASSLTPGCRTPEKCRDGKYCEDIPAGAVPQPLGTVSCQWHHAQTARAAQDSLMFYRSEWQGDTAELAAPSMARLQQNMSLLSDPAVSVLVEPIADAELNDARRAHLVEILTIAGVSDAEARVRLGRGEALGLYGIEAPRIVPGFLGYGRGGAMGGGMGAGMGMGGGTGGGMGMGGSMGGGMGGYGGGGVF